MAGTANCNSSSQREYTCRGGFTITCSLGTLDGYELSFVFVPATLTITRAPLVLAGNNVSRLYGDANPALTGTVSGLKAAIGNRNVFDCRACQPAR